MKIVIDKLNDMFQLVQHHRRLGGHKVDVTGGTILFTAEFNRRYPDHIKRFEERAAREYPQLTVKVQGR